MGYKGQIPWNKGKKGLTKHTQEWKDFMSVKMSGRKITWGNKISEALKGREVTWGYKISKSQKGRSVSEETKIKMKEWKQNNREKHGSWKGENVGYRGLHYWIQNRLGKPDTCELCEKSGLSGHFIHWANISREYKRELNDWIRLCAKCHKAYDKGSIPSN